MNKELTPLEALENIRTLFIGSPIDLSQQFAIIKTALIEREELGLFKVVFEMRYKNHEELENYFKVMEMELKALKIIKKYQDVIYICKEYDEEDYTQKEIKEMGGQRYYLCDGSDQYRKHEITQEEYDLLKEVLL